MILQLNEFKQKILGCWAGKNIGGTLGAPFECKRGVFDITYYTQILDGEPQPNDDLDLQLVWLNAIEKYGRNVNASILGEYWHSYIIPNWGEYGAGKNNMRIGLIPPLSGYVDNIYRDSCGAFIRSEIWACIAPGHPDIAVRYAYEDAIVDHSHEGVYAEIFCAALESAAFAENDILKLINIGLSYIPEDCGVAIGIKTVIDSYKSGLSWKEARRKLLTVVPGSFGMLGTLPENLTEDIPIGKIGWDAPSNIGIIIIGWLYGENDFGKSLCIAVGCGEDADCTAATLGSILGIIRGIDGIPKKWIEPIGDNIKTLCLNLTEQGLAIPKTIAEMTDRILKLTPIFLGSDICDFITSEKGYTISMLEGDKLFNNPTRINAWVSKDFKDFLKQSPFVTKHDFTIFCTFLDYCEEPFIQENVPKKFRLIIENNLFKQQWLAIKWHIPKNWEISPGINLATSLEQYHCNIGRTEMEFIIIGKCLNQEKYDLFVEISSNGRHTKGIIPVILINKPFKYYDIATNEH